MLPGEAKGPLCSTLRCWRTPETEPKRLCETCIIVIYERCMAAISGLGSATVCFACTDTACAFDGQLQQGRALQAGGNTTLRLVIINIIRSHKRGLQASPTHSAPSSGPEGCLSATTHNGTGAKHGQYQNQTKTVACLSTNDRKAALFSRDMYITVACLSWTHLPGAGPRGAHLGMTQGTSLTEPRATASAVRFNYCLLHNI